MKFIYLLSLLLFCSCASVNRTPSADSATSVSELEGRYLELDSFDIKDIKGHKGACSPEQLKRKIFRNYVEFNSDSPIILKATNHCHNEPTFNVVILKKTENESLANDGWVTIILANGYGKTPGLLSELSNEERFQLADEEFLKKIGLPAHFVGTARCHINKYGTFKMGYGEAYCLIKGADPIKDGNNSWVKFIIK